MASIKDTSIWVVITFVIATLFGNGAYWKWKEGKIAARQNQVDEVIKLESLEKDINAKYQTILELTNQYIDAQDDYRKTANPATRNKIIQQKSHLELVKSEFIELERRLATLENRQPRAIPIDFVPPPPPTNLRVVK